MSKDSDFSQTAEAIPTEAMPTYPLPVSIQVGWAQTNDGEKFALTGRHEPLLPASGHGCRIG
jgi:hypothetical protein